jgi:hypothetical protein
MSAQANKSMSDIAAKEARRGRKSGRKKRSDNSEKRIIAQCSRLLGKEVESLQYPGGRSRDSFRAMLKNGNSVIVSLRPNLNRAETECIVLKELSKKGALVPRLLASNGKKLLIQEEIAGERLSQALHGQNESRVEQLLDASLTSLGDIHQAGSQSRLDSRLATLGGNSDWVAGLLDRPTVLGNILEIPAPRPKLKQLKSLLAVRKPKFIKWDSRPGNAMVREDGKVYWFDWEHCGARNRLDDMAWLLADEYVPDYPAVEERLIDKHIDRFADDLSIDEARQYLSAYGVFHMTVRLGLICDYKLEGSWWDHNYCLQRDKIGISWEGMLRTCRRGQRWAKMNPYTEALAPWFEAVADRFEMESLEDSVHVR